MNDLGAIACRNANFILGLRKKGETFTLDQVHEEDLKIAGFIKTQRNTFFAKNKFKN